tara:strand:- start:2741 stop:2878 length:138 start_codon:yes stop_codon:yes gene_type:complete
MKRNKEESELDQFSRIAMARLRSKYKFTPQRRSVVAKMWRNRKEK